MFDNGNELKYHIFKDYNIAFDEKGSTCGSVRKIQWVKGDNEPEEEKAKIEIRKLYINADGERCGKGYTFSTPEGPGELIVGMIGAGFGDTKEILREVRKRDDFLEAAKTINDDADDSSTGEVFDMRDLLLGMDKESSDDDEDEVDADAV